MAASSPLVDLPAALGATLDQSPSIRKQAEAKLISLEQQPGFSLALLELVQVDSTNDLIRYAAALYFKNFLKKSWQPQDGDVDILSLEDRLKVKQYVVHTMTVVPSKYQIQLSDAVAIIADTDFPDQWPTLIDDLVKRLDFQNPTGINGVLQTAHTIFSRWKKYTLDNSMALEINGVLAIFSQPYFQLLLHVHQLIEAHKTDKVALPILFESLELITKIFYDFNYHDLPAFFEEKHKEFMNVFHHYLVTDYPAISKSDDSAGPLENVRSRIAEIIDLYAKRYEEEFTTMPDFVQTMWKILMVIGQEEKNDEFISRAIGFLSSIVKHQRHSKHFEDPATLRSILEKIVLPNMELRESDVESFEDEPVSWIRRDVEGSDADSRRKASSELVRALLENFGPQITTMGSEYVGKYLQLYQSNPQENWKAKDTAFFLITALTLKNQTAKAGAVSINENIEILPIFVAHVLPDLQAPANTIHPIVKVDAIKYLMLFRSQ
ncbi:importin-alpha export receptor, partial [Nowakowskiella sp. JEL0078]